MYKKELLTIFITALLTAGAIIIPSEGWLRLILFAIPYLLIGWEVLWGALRNLLRGQLFDENFLMSIATVGAFALGEYPEGVAVMLFFRIGELFEEYAVGRARRSIAELMDIRPDYANIEKDGALRQVDPDSVQVDDMIIIKAGERIPLDGVVIDGMSTVDTAALTGEALPREVSIGDEVISGCVNLDGLLKVRVTKEFGQSTVSKILELVERASSKKATTEQFITRFARYYTPVVVITATLLAILPPLLLNGVWGDWIERALIFLVISCPCALVISVPLSFFGGIGAASKQGILVKGGNYLEALCKVATVVFDKTGTLTKGNFCVTEVHAVSGDQEHLLLLATLAESYSDHPISRSLKQAYGKAIDTTCVTETQHIAGCGVRATIDGRTIWAGNAKLMHSAGVVFDPCDKIGTVVYVAEDSQYLGYIVITDEIKPDAARTIGELKALGVTHIAMMTGDSASVANWIGAQLQLDEVASELLPAHKVERVEQLLATCPAKLAFVGDGINDAPVLSRADVGIAMGGMGSDAAIEAADIVLMDDSPSKLPVAIAIARRTLKIAKQNIAFALGVKFAILLLGALGLANMWAAVFADVGVSVMAILNASRALRYHNQKISA